MIGFELQHYAMVCLIKWNHDYKEYPEHMIGEHFRFEVQSLNYSMREMEELLSEKTSLAPF